MDAVLGVLQPVPIGGRGVSKPSDAELHLQLAADVDALTRPRPHSETLDNGQRHHHRHESLLAQLEEAAAMDAGETSETRSIPASRPPVAEEPFNLLIDAQHAMRGILRRHKIRQRDTLRGNLLLIVGVAIGNPDLLAEAAPEVATLRARAEVVLSWKPRAMRPRIKCPACDKVGTIAVQLDDYGPTEAKCSKCGTHWEKAHLGLLAGATT